MRGSAGNGGTPIEPDQAGMMGMAFRFQGLAERIKNVGTP